MARHSDSILELARKGASVRYHELKAELASLMKAFPHIRFGSAVSPAIDLSSDPLAATAGRRRRRRRTKLSAAGRRAIAAAQRARWAAIKQAKAGGGRKRKGMSPAARKAVSARMKKYWAARRKAKGHA